MTIKRTVALLLISLFILSIFATGIGEGTKPPRDATGYYHWIEVIQGDIPETQEIEAHDLLTIQDAMLYVIPWNISRIYVNLPDDATLTRFVDVHNTYFNESTGLSDYPGWYYWDFPPEASREDSSQTVHNGSLDFQEGTFNATKINITDNQIKLQDGLNLGEYVSNDIVINGVNISSAKIIIDSTYSENVSLSISNNNGTSWHPCLNDTYLDFDTEGISLRYKFNISGNSTIRPIVDYVEMSYNYTPMATTMALMTEYTITSDPESEEFSFEKELLYDIEEPVIYIYVEEGHVIESTNVTWIDPDDPNITPQLKEKYPGKELHVGTVEPGGSFTFTISPEKGTGEDPLILFSIIAVIIILVATVTYFRRRVDKPIEKTDDDKEPDEEETESAANEKADIEDAEPIDKEILKERKQKILTALKNLDKDFEDGIISEESYNDIKAKYRQEAINVLKKLDK